MTPTRTARTKLAAWKPYGIRVVLVVLVVLAFSKLLRLPSALTSMPAADGARRRAPCPISFSSKMLGLLGQTHFPQYWQWFGSDRVLGREFDC